MIFNLKKKRKHCPCAGNDPICHLCGGTGLYYPTPLPKESKAARSISTLSHTLFGLLIVALVVLLFGLALLRVSQ